MGVVIHAGVTSVGGDQVTILGVPSIGGLAGVEGISTQFDLTGKLLSALNGVTGFKNLLFLNVSR